MCLRPDKYFTPLAAPKLTAAGYEPETAAGYRRRNNRRSACSSADPGRRYRRGDGSGFVYRMSCGGWNDGHRRRARRKVR